MFRQEYAHLAIFEGLSAAQLELLSPLLEICHFPTEETIFQQGQVADYLYILLLGEVVIRYKPYDGPPLTVSRIAPGGVFGWSAALGRQEYTSAAVAAGPCEAYRISGQDLQQLCERHPDAGAMLLERLASVITERLRGTHNQILNILSQGVERNGDCSPRSDKK